MAVPLSSGVERSDAYEVYSDPAQVKAFDYGVVGAIEGIINKFNVVRKNLERLISASKYDYRYTFHKYKNLNITKRFI